MPQKYRVALSDGRTFDVETEGGPPDEASIMAQLSASNKPADEPSFMPKTAREFGSRLANAAVDVPIGMAKNLGRAVQMIPGVTAATDALYGLPKGASEQAMQPTNATQTAGGYVGDLALMAATAGAEAGGPILSKAAGYISNPTVKEQAVNAARQGAGFAADTVKAAVKAQLAKGPVTPEKVAELIVKYGKEAVKGALVTAGGYGTWRTVRHLF